MTDWLKRFFLSLFSDKQAKQSVRFGFGNILITAFLSAIFIFLGIFAGKTVPFAAYYNGADDFRGFLHNAFADGGAGITVSVNQGGADISAAGKQVLINTFSNESDRAEYFVNGYHLIVDSRNVASVYVDFDAYCIDSDGRKITYGEYLSLSESDRYGYRFTVEYTQDEKQVTEEEAAAYSEYLKKLDDGNVKSQYEALEEKKGETSADDYRKSLYVLYITSYYPEMYSVTGESAPSLRNYYYRLTTQAEGRYFCLFGDMMAASYRSYNSNTVVFGGVYKQGNTLNTADLGGEQARQAVDKFVKNLYYDGLSTLFLFDLTNSLSLIAIVEFIIVGVMLLCFALGKLRNSDFCLTFAVSVKIVGSYSHMAALIAALAAFSIGFIFSGSAVEIAAYALFGGILVIRTIILVLYKNRKDVQELK